MEPKTQNDHRKVEIEACLLGIMQTMSYEDITVKDLAEKMNMARKTFYHYFPSKKACLESMIDRIIGEYNLNLLLVTREDSVLAELYEKRIHFWMEHRTFLNAINRNKLGSEFLNRFLLYLHREDSELRKQLSRPHVEYDEDILFFFLSGHVFLLLKWCNEGFSLPVEEMVRKNIRLLHEPLLPPEM